MLLPQREASLSNASTGRLVIEQRSRESPARGGSALLCAHANRPITFPTLTHHFPCDLWPDWGGRRRGNFVSSWEQMDVAVLKTEPRVVSFFPPTEEPPCFKGIGFMHHNGLLMTSYYGTFSENDLPFFPLGWHRTLTVLSGKWDLMFSKYFKYSVAVENFSVVFFVLCRRKSKLRLFCLWSKMASNGIKWCMM